MHACILSTRDNGGVSTSRPEVVAHRGSSYLEPEHTLAAYRRAIDDGADALECDVRLTSDGTLVCVHDRSINRTSHGSGSVSGRDIDELSEHDYSHRSWHDFEDPDNPERTELLTLERLLTTALEKNSDIRFAIETKHPVRYGGYVERELADVLAPAELVDGRGTYWNGKSLGRAGLLLPIAEQLGDDEAANRILSEMKAAMEDWLHVDPTSDEPDDRFLAYDAD